MTEILAAVTLAPLALGLFFIIASATMDERHNVLRVFLFMLSITSFWFSMTIGAAAVAEVYDYTDVENAIARVVRFSVWAFGFIMSYYVAYFMYWMVTAIMQKKREALEY